MYHSRKHMGRKHRKTQKNVVSPKVGGWVPKGPKVGGWTQNVGGWTQNVGGWRPKTKSVKSSTTKSYRTKYSVKSNK